GDAIVDERIGTDLAKAPCRQYRFDVRDQLRAEPLLPESRFGPDAFEERYRAGLAAVGIGAQRDLGKSGGLAVDGFGNEAPGMGAGEECLDLGRVQLHGCVGPQRGAHFGPRCAVPRLHFPDEESHGATLPSGTARSRTEGHYSPLMLDSRMAWPYSSWRLRMS